MVLRDRSWLGGAARWRSAAEALEDKPENAGHDHDPEDPPDVHPTHAHAAISVHHSPHLHRSLRAGASLAGAMLFIIGHLAIESSMPFIIPIRMCSIMCFIISGCLDRCCGLIVTGTNVGYSKT
jgi:hypothetical protein